MKEQFFIPTSHTYQPKPMNLPHLPIETEHYDGLIRYKTSAATLIAFSSGDPVSHKYLPGIEWPQGFYQNMSFIFKTKKGRFFEQSQLMYKRTHWFSQDDSWECMNEYLYIRPLTPLEALEAIRGVRGIVYTKLVDVESVFSDDVEDA